MTGYWTAADTSSIELYPPGWAQPWGWMRYHYYNIGKEVPMCGNPSAPRRNGEDMLDTIPPPEFLELFEDEGFGIHEPPMIVCKRCYKKFMEIHR